MEPNLKLYESCVYIYIYLYTVHIVIRIVFFHLP